LQNLNEKYADTAGMTFHPWTGPASAGPGLFFKMHFKKSMIVSFLILTATVPAVRAGTPVATRDFTVPDGNHVLINDTRYRLAGIEAPMPGEKCHLRGKLRDCGIIARAALMDLTAGATLVCRAAGQAGYNCRADGYDLSEGMAYTGWAVTRPGAPLRYRAVLREARLKKRGFWRGLFIRQWTPFFPR
jgi:endonuclease YncB( thermonuclease family)